jgi:hypothetical protein
MTWIEDNDRLLAQVREQGPLLPVDAGRFDPLAPFAGLMELAQDPGRFALDRSVDLVQRHPLGSRDNQTLRADNETDIAAARAPELVGDQRRAQQRLPVGLWMAKPRRRQRLVQGHRRQRRTSQIGIRRGTADGPGAAARNARGVFFGGGGGGGADGIEQIESELEQPVHGSQVYFFSS